MQWLPRREIFLRAGKVEVIKSGESVIERRDHCRPLDIVSRSHEAQGASGP